MLTRRVVKENGKIKKFLKKKKGEDEVQLPVFSTCDDGTWQYEGLTYVTTLEEYNEYKQTYSELMGFIYENFNSAIAKLYKKSLNNLIFIDKKDYDKEFLDELNVSSRKPVSEGKIMAARRSKDVESYEETAMQNLESIVNIVRFMQGGRKRYVPSEIIKFIKNGGLENSDKMYFIPQFSDKGIVSSIGEESGNIELEFVIADEGQVNAMQDYMNSLSNGENEKMIKNYFNECNMLTKLNDSSEEYSSVLADVVTKSKYFFDLDPTNYLKKERVQVEALAGNQEEIFDNSVFADTEGYEGNVNQNEMQQNLPGEEIPQGTYVDSIQMNSPFVSTAAIKDQNVIVNVTTRDGSRFKISLDGSKLLVDEENNEETTQLG